ncbi:polysaccharide pyruvyl transferase family protein [Francisella hispaniensis]|nr:polysaccharide pyruvyl transferase family protein [Francisella hispaniensis]
MFKKAHAKLKMTNFSKNINNIDTSRYDIIIIGSDIVWNYEWSFLGNDPVYFGENLKAKKLISYAPSCGSVNLSNPIPTFVKDGLKKFSHISVRDENTALLVEKAIAKKAKIVLDPTFIYDIQGEEIEPNEKEEYILVYAYRLGENEKNTIIKFSKEKKMKLISVGYSNSWCDKNIIDIGPFEWLGYFKNAKYVLTSTFHGTIFSLKYKRNFVTSANSGIETKIKTMLENIGLSSRVVNDTDVSEVLNNCIEYNVVDKKLDILIKDSRNFLIKAIDD